MRKEVLRLTENSTFRNANSHLNSYITFIHMTNNCITCIWYILLGFTFLIGFVCLACQTAARVILHVNLSEFKMKLTWKWSLNCWNLVKFDKKLWALESVVYINSWIGQDQDNALRSCGSRSMVSMDKKCLMWDIPSSVSDAKIEGISNANGSRTSAMSKHQCLCGWKTCQIRQRQKKWL